MWGCIFRKLLIETTYIHIPVDLSSHSTFCLLTFFDRWRFYVDILSVNPVDIFAIRHYVPFGVYYIPHYFQSTFFPFRCFVPFGVYYHPSYVLSSLFTIRRLSFRCFFPLDVFPTAVYFISQEPEFQVKILTGRTHQQDPHEEKIITGTANEKTLQSSFESMKRPNQEGSCGEEGRERHLSIIPRTTS
jgi:hypothetical protein